MADYNKRTSLMHPRTFSSDSLGQGILSDVEGSVQLTLSR